MPGPFNDAGESMMTASDYSRECESDYYDRDEYDDRDGDRADAMAEEYYERIHDPIKNALELFGLEGTHEQVEKVEEYLNNEYLSVRKNERFTDGKINDAIEEMLPDLQGLQEIEDEDCDE